MTVNDVVILEKYRKFGVNRIGFVEFIDVNYVITIACPGDELQLSNKVSINSGSVRLNELKLTNKIVAARTLGDAHERAELERDLTDLYEREMRDHSLSRRFVIRRNYQEQPHVASCISLIQFYADDTENKLDMYVFVRSQHINNFDYDNQTFCMLYADLYNMCINNYGKYTHFEPGSIYVHVTSLHIEKELLLDSVKTVFGLRPVIDMLASSNPELFERIDI